MKLGPDTRNAIESIRSGMNAMQQTATISALSRRDTAARSHAPQAG